MLDNCNAALTSAIFKFAATSPTLSKLHIETVRGSRDGHCTITTSMVNDLSEWIILRPIQNLVIGWYTWEDIAVRNQVAATLLKSPTVNCFAIHGNDVGDISFDGYCGRYNSRVYLDFYDPRRYRGIETVFVELEELIVDHITHDLSGLIQPFFQSLLDPKVKKLSFNGRGNLSNSVVWEMLLPTLEQSHLEELDLCSNRMTDQEAFRLADTIRSMESLKKIFLENNLLGYAVLWPSLQPLQLP
ncbi:unnamed protein product [Aphanomyces euteiches]|nr:hypothetical protein Ae201684P_006846 [Aphanomyces euteiches]